MSTKREEKSAFEKLKKSFPEHDVSLDYRHESWTGEPYYKAYVSEGDPSFTQSSTAMEAVNLMIAARKQ